MHGVNVLLMGPAGTGKTYSLGTIVDQGNPVFYLGIEAGIESLYGYYTDNGKPIPENLHWHVVEAQQAGLKEMFAMAKRVNMVSYGDLAKSSDPNRSKYDLWLKILKALNNFVDQRTGEEFGSVDEFPTEYTLVIDGLSGLNKAVMENVAGSNPAKSQSDWGVAQNLLLNLINFLCYSCKSHFVLISHVDRETDQVLGGVKLMVAALGKKLAPQIPPMFSDVILAEREGDKWKWNTASMTADVKTRNLAISSKLEPSFKPLFAKWQSRCEAAKESVATEETN